MNIYESNIGTIFIMDENKLLVKYNLKILLNIQLFLKNGITFKYNYIETKTPDFLILYEEYIWYKGFISKKKRSYMKEFWAMSILNPKIQQKIYYYDQLDFIWCDELGEDIEYIDNGIKIIKKENNIKIFYKQENIQLLIYFLEEIANSSDDSLLFYINNLEIKWDFWLIFTNLTNNKSIEIRHLSNLLNNYSLRIEIKY